MFRKAFFASAIVTGILVVSGATTHAQVGATAPTGLKLPPTAVSEELTIAPKTVRVLGSDMSYLESGSGDVVLFIHGNPTSSYLWRNIIPYAAGTHRAIAVDLIGMGRSGKPDIGYTFADHYKYLAAFIDAMKLEHITIVGHDWGATLAWEYARRNPSAVEKIAFMEGVLPPAFPAPSFDALGPQAGGMFRALRDPAQGTQMVIENNMFVEQFLPSVINRPLGATAHNAYRAPFAEKQSRLPTLVWSRELPIGGEPASVVAVLNDVTAFMTKTQMPVLLLYAEPGAATPLQVVDWFAANVPNIETSYIGQAFHFVQEDQPDAIGRALKDWLRRN